MIAPVLEKIAEENDGKLIVAKVNTDENPEWAMHFGVQGIPTLLFVENGDVFDHLVGAAPPPIITGKVEVLLKAAQGVHE
jgi:thioredoxin 1